MTACIELALIPLVLGFGFIRRIKAKYHKVPFEIKGWWPAYRRMKSKEGYQGFEPLFFNPNKNVGDVVDVLHDFQGVVHSYKITKKFRAPGSDHVINPLEFNLQYHSTREIDPGNYDVDDIKDFYLPELLRNNL